MNDTTEKLSSYYLYRMPDQRVVVGIDLPQESLLLAGPVEAASWTEAREKLQEHIRLHLRRLEGATEDLPGREPVFRSAHEALTFAFRFAGQQSPKTPMTTLMQAAGGGIGSGRGLVGLDGAGQAGMVLAALKHLGPEQRFVLIARYGDVRRPCPCCGQPAADQVWLEAVEELSRCEELKDLPKQVRHAAIEKAVCRRKLRLQDYAVEYGLSPRTLRHKLAEVKQRFGKVENAAMAWLDDFFRARGVLIEEV